MPVRNEGPHVDFTMESLLVSSRPPDEIIVADGESTDDTRRLFLAYAETGVNIRVIPNRGIFSGAGRNAGFRESTSDIVLFADCSNTVSENWVEEMVRPLEECADIDIVCGVVEPHVESEFEHYLAAIHYTDSYNLGELTPEMKASFTPSIILPGGGSIAMRREIFETLGGYPEWLHRAQDKLFSRKAYARGMRVYPNWDARIQHHMRSNTRQVFRLTFEYGRGNGRSRYVSRHSLKLTAIYCVLCMLMVGGLHSRWSLFAGLVGLGVYSFRSGSLKVIRKDGGMRSMTVLLAPLWILWPRDLGTIIGHAVGWFEWLFVARFRQQFWGYMKGCDKRRLFIIEPR